MNDKKQRVNKEREFQAKEITDFGGGKEKQTRDLCGSREMENVYKREMRLEGQKGPARVVMESKFYSMCYMTPLKDFKQKEKKKCHPLGVPSAWHITGAQRLGE